MIGIWEKFLSDKFLFDNGPSLNTLDLTCLRQFLIWGGDRKSPLQGVMFQIGDKLHKGSCELVGCAAPLPNHSLPSAIGLLLLLLCWTMLFPPKNELWFGAKLLAEKQAIFASLARIRNHLLGINDKTSLILRYLNPC